MYDKVVNHLVSRELLIPYLTSCLIDSNVASRKGKGTSYGRKLYFQYRHTMDQKYSRYYLLKIDIRGYFSHIHHDILKDKYHNYLTRCEENDNLIYIESFDKIHTLKNIFIIKIQHKNATIMNKFYLTV